MSNYALRSYLRDDINASLHMSLERYNATPKFNMADKSFMLDLSNLPPHKVNNFFTPGRQYVNQIKSVSHDPNSNYYEQYCPPFYSRYDIAPTCSNYDTVINKLGWNN